MSIYALSDSALSSRLMQIQAALDTPDLQKGGITRYVNFRAEMSMPNRCEYCLTDGGRGRRGDCLNCGATK